MLFRMGVIWGFYGMVCSGDGDRGRLVSPTALCSHVIITIAFFLNIYIVCMYTVAGQCHSVPTECLEEFARL